MIFLLKKAVSLFCALILIFSFASVNANAVSAQAYVLYYPAAKEVLSSQNAETQLSMASTTKIMTGLIICSQPDLSRMIEVKPSMLRVEGTSAGLCAGDRISLYDLCCGLLLESGNDAANCAAYAISGSIPKFAALMNQTAKKIGMKNTSFVTPSGLDDEKHYTTALDMAYLAAAAMKNPTFKEIVGKKSHRANYNGGDTIRTYYNHNRLLRSLDGCIGIKTGFTKKSGRCLVSACERNGAMLIMVTLNAPDDWNDHITAYNSAFSNMKTLRADNVKLKYEIPVYSGDKSKIKVRGEAFECSVPSSSKAQLSVRIRLPAFLYASVKNGDIVGYADYYIGDEKIAELPFTATEKSDIIEIRRSFAGKLLKSLLRILMQ